MKYDITALGEILIDFTPAGRDDAGDWMFARKAGGAPVNLLATVSKFGGRTAFIGKVGNDLFGRFLRSTLQQLHIADAGLRTDDRHHTTLAFVALNERGERDFSFYRHDGADVFLDKSEIDEQLIQNSAIFHFGSLSLTAEPARSATEYALAVARAAGCLITYDPNYREPLWPDRETAVRLMRRHLDKVDILKISKEELLLLFGGSGEAAVREAMACGIRILLVTDGANGAELHMENAHLHMPAEKVHTVDTTGAGDIFFGTFLSEWIRDRSTLSGITADRAAGYLKKAIHIAGKSTEHHGAIASIYREERKDQG